ncbi:MAG: endonuclease VII domain-containing protein [Nitrososphaera sp.]|nr:endonuclease VII domain-containing protein [Nitrososphaera sp.]
MTVSAVERATQWNREHPERRRKTANKYTRSVKGLLNKRRAVVARHGITLEDYNKLWDLQNGVCAICRQPETAKRNGSAVSHLAVDHDHRTGRIRSLLCDRCNRALGTVNDNIELLKQLIQYLENFLGH